MGKDLLLKHCKIIDPRSSFHHTFQDILIREGKIHSIGAEIEVEGAEVINQHGMEVYPGWLDIGVHTNDPGFEHREDMSSVTATAAAGGFTGIVSLPNTRPVVQSKTDINYAQQFSSRQVVQIYPAGALTHNCKGEEITEMLDMHHAGAVLFSDGLHSVKHAGVFLRALQYVKSFDGLVMHHALDPHLAGEGQLHEGFTSTTLGMRGIPALAEEIMIQRDLSLLAYSESKLYLHAISTAGAVEQIRRAKADGLSVTCSVAYLNLLYTDEDLAGFNSDLKVLPPLRSKSDRQALLEGLADGTIDAICSNHVPLEQEQKKLEFSYASFGASGLQTVYSALQTKLKEPLDPGLLAEKLAHGPRSILQLDEIRIEAEAKAELTLCLPADHWSLDRRNNQSKSENNPFWKSILKGKIIGVINGQQSMFFDA